ncbi:glycosidase [Synechococcus sp. RSCCF101]|nr:glycosidase [Synechococcus sp. RSCCF101]
MAAALLSHRLQRTPAPATAGWDQRTAVLIGYADAVQAPGEPGLRTLRRFLDQHCPGLFPVLHVLPFLESTSDGGFAISNHTRIDPAYGDWVDLAALAEGRTLMADLVLNHVSSSHRWVQDFRRGAVPGGQMVLARPSEEGWDQVVRPRSSALFTRVETAQGPRELWTTFGPDQVDLDWRNPAVLVEFVAQIDRLLSHGAHWIRLDAVGFLWKEAGSSCIHLPRTHALVKVLRMVLQAREFAAVMVSETNVPEEENLSYLRPGDEAQLAYNFPLPPLLLECLTSGRADLLNSWLCRWPVLPAGTALLNFSASHDGIGLRPVEGLMPEERLQRLLRHCEIQGGLISHRRRADGSDSPYEINITWWSAMADSGGGDTLQWERYLCSQLLVAALAGVPAFYLPTLLTSRNDRGRFARTGLRRDLNRERFLEEAVNRRLRDPDAPAARALAAIGHALRVRHQLRAFHPEAPMRCLSGSRSDLVLLRRGEDGHHVWAVHNMTAERLNLPLARLLQAADGQPLAPQPLVDRLSGSLLEAATPTIPPYGVLWLQGLG